MKLTHSLALIALLSAIASCNSSGTDKIVLKSTDPLYGDGIENAVFFAPGVKGLQRKSYLYFFSEDSCFSKHSGFLNGYILHYYEKDDSIAVEYTDKTRTYKLLGNQILMDEERAFYRVKDFSEAFMSNQLEEY